MQETKRCAKCGNNKPLTEFAKNSKHKDGHGSYCLPCNRAHMAAWRKKNPERVLATLAAWQAANPEKLPQYRKKWADDNPDRVLEYGRAWYSRNTEQALAKNARWNKTNPDSRRELNRLRYARRKGVKSIKFTAAQLEQRMAYYGNRCWICRGPREAIDHVKPITKGGAHMLCNLRPICTSCNSKKRNRWPFAI